MLTQIERADSHHSERKRSRKPLHTVLFTLLCAGATVGAHALEALQVVPNLDVQRYVGRWYEIAKFPNRFQKKCMSDTSAQYSVMPDARLQVLNQCRVQSGDMDQALGMARQIGGPASAKLEVRFAPAWLSWVPFVWGDYWVIDLDPAYDLVAVSEPRREYLWILARTPTVESSRYATLLQRLSVMGLDVHKLEKTLHTLP